MYKGGGGVNTQDGVKDYWFRSGTVSNGAADEWWCIGGVLYSYGACSLNPSNLSTEGFSYKTQRYHSAAVDHYRRHVDGARWPVHPCRAAANLQDNRILAAVGADDIGIVPMNLRA